jgi:acetylornithine deacetylase
MKTGAPSVREMLAALIAAPSISSVSPEFDQSNRVVVHLLAGWLESMGFAVDEQEVAGFPGKSNLIASLGQGPGGLVLAGHTDTVPCDPELWGSDPFALTERSGRLYGLGTSDMKGFFPLVIEAVRGIDAGRLQAPLIVLATADEESSMCGARALVEAGRPRARYAVVGEPTGLRPARLHKGIIMEAVHLHGRSGHSSDPSLGANALEAMHEAIGDILAWRDELQRRYRNPAFAVPIPTLNLGHIHGGDNPNRICGDCELHFDLRPLPGMDLQALRDELAARLDRRFAGSDVELRIRSLFPGLPAMETAADSPLVHAAEELTGHSAGAVAFGTEGPFLNELGMQTVILGPGDIDQAHQPDEFLALDRVEPTVSLLRSLIEQFCLNPR